MSIIEHALKKSRTSEQANRPRRTGGDALERTQPVATIDPELRIVPLSVTVDSSLCRERRLLLDARDESDSATVAAYRMLRTRLLQRARAKDWRVIAVTSAGPNDGKTLTALNLALSMARDKSREIVLLDLDMRNPSVCRVLDVQPRHELRDYLEGGDHLRELFFSVGTDNLLIAGSTRPTQHASELLASPRFEELLRSLRQGAVDPVVLIDLPPVLLTDDALVVAPKVDAVLLVVSEGVTSRAEFAKALDVLSEFPIAGVALNRAAETAPGYDYSYNFNAD
jgi:protein-tyrosine kinase